MKRMNKILSSPVTLFVGILAGFLIAFFAKPLVPILRPFSTVYLNLLKMCVIPIVSTAVAVNLRRLVGHKTQGIMLRWILIVICGLLAAAAVGTGVSFLCRAWATPSADAIQQLTNTEDSADAITFYTVSYYEPEISQEVTENSFSMAEFLTDTVPTNIFESLTNNNMMQIIFFFVVVGVLLGILPAEETDVITAGLEGIYQMFCHFVKDILLFLPFGMCAMLAVQFAECDLVQMMGVVGKFILLQWGVMLLLTLIAFCIIQVRTGLSVKEHLKAIRKTFFVAFGTSSCIASISVAMEDSVDRLGLDEEVTKAILPIGITTFQYGVIASGAIAAVYGTSIYPVDVTVQTIIVILIGAIAFSLSIIGAPGVVAVSMLSIILTPLGIPSETIVLIYLATIPFFDPIAVFSSVYSNIAVTALVVPGKGKKEKNEVSE